MKIRISQRSLEFTSYIFFKIIFDIIYIFLISDNFSYLGSFLDFNLSKYIIGFIFIFIFSYFLVKSFPDNNFIFILKFLVVFSLIPTLSIYSLKDVGTYPFILMLLYWFIFFLSFYFINQQYVKYVETKDRNLDNINVKIVFLLSTILIILIWAVYSDFQIVTTFDDGTERRLYLRTLNMPGVIRYLMSWFGNVILPFIFIFFLSKRKYLLSLIVFLLGLLLFSINGLKTWLIIFPAIFGLFISYNIFKTSRSIIIMMGILSGIFGMLIFFFSLVSDDLLFVSLFHRIFSIPAELNYEYFYFFQNETYLFLRESILRNFFLSDFNGNLSFIIGERLTGNASSNANNGLFGDAYSNFGIIGVLIYPILITNIYYIFIRSFKINDKIIVLSVLFILTWNLINASLFSWLLTGGVIVLLILYMILKIKVIHNV